MFSNYVLETIYRLVKMGRVTYLVVLTLCFFGKSAVKIEGILCHFTIAIMILFGYNYIGRKLDFVVVKTLSRRC